MRFSQIEIVVSKIAVDNIIVFEIVVVKIVVVKIIECRNMMLDYKVWLGYSQLRYV